MNDTRAVPAGQPVTLHGHTLDAADAAGRLATPGAVVGYADSDGRPVVTALDELADAEGGAA